jgi:hypothetical protein
MSSPKAAKATKSEKSAKPAKASKAAAKAASSSPRSKAADGHVFVGEDKVNFVKALWEGVTPKGDKTSSGSKSGVEKSKAGKAKAEKVKADKPKAAKAEKAAKADKSKSGKAAKAAKAEKQPKVEILRKISAPVRSESRQTPESDQALALVRALEAKFDAGELDVLTPEATQALMGVICRIYGANQESGNKYSLLSGRAAVTGTDAMITCSALLKAVDLQVFELGMWQSWSGV